MEAKKKTVQTPSKIVPWWQELFRGGYFRSIMDNIPSRRTMQQVRFIMKALELKNRGSVLDICCGTGRHLIPLVKRGIKATGVDLCPVYVQEAERKAKKAKAELNLICEDARNIKFHEEFSGAINMWTSIGFFEKETDNFRVIKKAYEALKPGGGFLLDTVNRDGLVRNFTRKHWWESGDYRVLQESEFDLTTARLNMIWTFNGKGEEIHKEISVRIYCFHELREYFEKAGFEEVTAYGAFDFSPLSIDSGRLLIVGKKPR